MGTLRRFVRMNHASDKYLWYTHITFENRTSSCARTFLLITTCARAVRFISREGDDYQHVFNARFERQACLDAIFPPLCRNRRSNKRSNGRIAMRTPPHKIIDSFPLLLSPKAISEQLDWEGRENVASWSARFWFPSLSRIFSLPLSIYLPLSFLHPPDKYPLPDK